MMLITMNAENKIEPLRKELLRDNAVIEVEDF